MDWFKMLLWGGGLVLGGLVLSRFAALGWVVAASGGAAVQAALIGAAVRGPD